MIGVVADDLTGAAELGAVGWRYGLSSEVLVAGRPGGGSELVCVDTDSRGCPPEEAGRRAATAARELRSAGAKWIYKKVDSVLRGQIVAELEAVMRELSLPRTLLVPVNPSLGRVIRQGHYLVQGKPIHETDFRFDPEYPRRSSEVGQLLGNSISAAIHVCRADESLPPAGIIVGEAASADDLQRWASRRAESTLLAGGADFFAARLTAAGFQAADRSEDSPPAASSDKKLFVSGSTSEACHEFVTRSREQGVPVFSLPPEVAQGRGFAATVRQQLADQIVAALRAKPGAILSIGLPLVSEPSIARQLTGHLTDLAQAVLARTQGIHVHVEGGATAASLIRRMNWTRLKVVRELAPGVVLLRPDSDPPGLLTLKPGSYRWSETEWKPVAGGESPA